MTRIAKLDERFRGGQALSFADLLKLLDAYGFSQVRTAGSHRIFVRADVPEQVNVQPDGKDAKPYQVSQFGV